MKLDFAVDKFNNILTPTDKEDFFQIQKSLGIFNIRPN